MRKLPFLRLYGNASFKRKSRGLTSPAPTTSVWVNVSVEVKQDDKPFFRKKSGIQIYIKNRIKRLKRDKIMYFTPFYALVGRGGFEGRTAKNRPKKCQKSMFFTVFGAVSAVSALKFWACFGHELRLFDSLPVETPHNRFLRFPHNGYTYRY